MPLYSQSCQLTTVCCTKLLNKTILNSALAQYTHFTPTIEISGPRRNPPNLALGQTEVDGDRLSAAIASTRKRTNSLPFTQGFCSCSIL